MTDGYNWDTRGERSKPTIMDGFATLEPDEKVSIIAYMINLLPLEQVESIHKYALRRSAELRRPEPLPEVALSSPQAPQTVQDEADELRPAQEPDDAS